jgi:hypothetical protein
MILTWTDKDSGEAKRLRFDIVSKESVESILKITSHPVEEGEDIVDNAHTSPIKISIEGYVSNAPLPSNPRVFFGKEVSPTMSLVPTSVPLNLSDANTPPSLASKTVPLDMSSANTPDKNFPLTPGALTKTITGGISGLFGKPPPLPTSFLGYNALAKTASEAAPSKAAVFKAVDGFENRARAMFVALSEAQEKRARISVEIMLVTVDDMLIAKLSAPRQKEDGSGATFSLELERVRIVKSETVNAPVAAESRGEKPKAKGTVIPSLSDEADAKKANKSIAKRVQKTFFSGTPNPAGE